MCRGYTCLLIGYLLPSAIRIWFVYTSMTTTGWAVYTEAQLIVLYSRLHLVVRHAGIRLAVFYAIATICPVLIVLDWTTTWPTWNPKLSEKWSPADAVVERICQLGFSAMEITINVIYAVALVRLLKRRINVRQRRVMQDLIYVNALAAAFDFLNIILVYVNRVSVSHPIQTFSYAMKLRVEFIVLNQLVTVFGRGFRRERFEEKRYHRPSRLEDGWVGECLRRQETHELSPVCSPSYPNSTFCGDMRSTSAPKPIFLKV